MSQQQAQIDAVEQLLIAVLKSNKSTQSQQDVFEKAHAAIMGENGPSGTSEKTAASQYLDHLKLQVK